jgi:hypothetical protein
MYRRRTGGTFHFRGAVAGPHVAFVTHRMEGAASGPGLYEFRVSRRKRWAGTWALSGGQWTDRMWLRPQAGRPAAGRGPAAAPHDRPQRNR